MRSGDPRVSLADLSAVGLRLRPSQAVTIVRELIAQVLRGVVPGVPSAHVIRLSASGHVSVEGPVAAGRAVSRAATLLDSLLPPFDAPGDSRASGALRLVVARALGTLDLPAYQSLEAFSDALERFAEPASEATVRQLVSDWAAAAGAPAGLLAEVEADDSTRALPDPGRAAAALAKVDPVLVTISDIRRARRATGIPLLEISRRSRIPVSLLRQLEWGYLRNWPAGQYGRTQLVRYARACGLDEQVVLATVWPLVEQAAPAPDLATQGAPRPEVGDEHAVAGEAVIAPQPEFVLPDDLPLGHLHAEPVAPPRPRWRLAAAAAVLVAAGVLAASVFQQDALPIDAGLVAGFVDRIVERLPVTGIQQEASLPDAAATAGPPAGTPDQTASPVETAPVDASDPVATSGDAAADAPVSTPAISDADVGWSTARALEGSATFSEADQDSMGVRPASDDGGGATLRVTRVVDAHARNFHARLSPDGSRIAFDSDRDGVRGVYVADADGSNVRRVSGEGFAAIPSWAPDSRRLAFVRAEPDRPRVWNLWLVDVDSGHLRRLTSYRDGQSWGASWFPDGRRIAYSRGQRLIVLDVATGREDAHPSPREGRAVRSPAVSPDGRWLIFQVEGDGAWLLDLEKRAARKVMADPSADQYVWSPDGRRVAYYSRRTGEWGVWVVLAS